MAEPKASDVQKNLDEEILSRKSRDSEVSTKLAALTVRVDKLELDNAYLKSLCSTLAEDYSTCRSEQDLLQLQFITEKSRVDGLKRAVMRRG